MKKRGKKEKKMVGLKIPNEDHRFECTVAKDREGLKETTKTERRQREIRDGVSF